MDWKARIRALFATGTHVPDDGVTEELAQHAQAMYDHARADGLSHEEADRRVADQLDRWRIDAAALCHRSRRAAIVESAPSTSSSRLAGLAQDLRHSARLLRRQPRSTLLAILTMALGIGATTVLFSVTYGVLVKPLPWLHSDRLILLRETRGGHPPRFNSFTNAAYLAWREVAATIEDITVWSQRTVTLTVPGAGDPERIRITAASASLFRLLGARPLVGSLFEEKDEVSRVVVLSESLWRRHFAADPGRIGEIRPLQMATNENGSYTKRQMLYPPELWAHNLKDEARFRLAPKRTAVHQMH